MGTHARSNNSTQNSPRKTAPPRHASSSLPRTISTSLRRRSPRRVFFTLLTAVLLNHIRRLLLPWLFQFLYRHALEDMKTSRSAPHYFLDVNAQRTAWSAVALWAAMEMGGSALKRMVVRLKRRDGGERADEMLDVAGLAMLLAKGERVFTETCWVGATLHAWTTMLLSRDTNTRLFLHAAILPQTSKLILHALLILRWTLVVALPGLRTTVGELAKARPGLTVAQGVVWGTTVYLVRFSNKYFVLLEMSDMWVTFGWLVLGVVWMAWRMGRVLL